MGAEPRESSNYENHWRGEAPARYKTRRGYRPPPPILNRRYGTTSQESDDEVYDDRQVILENPWIPLERVVRWMKRWGINLDSLFIAELVGVQFTGRSLNPARSLGPCAITGKLTKSTGSTASLAILRIRVGPFVGSMIAVLFYRYIQILEYEMANPGADSDDVHPSKIVETTYVKAAPLIAPSSHT